MDIGLLAPPPTVPHAAVVTVVIGHTLHHIQVLVTAGVVEAAVEVPVLATAGQAGRRQGRL